MNNHQKGASRTIPRATESWQQLTLPTARVKKHMGCCIEYLEHYFLSSREKLEKAAQVLHNKAKMQYKDFQVICVPFQTQLKE